MYVLVNLKSAVCVPLVNFYLYQPKGKKGTLLPLFLVYVSPVESRPWLEQPVRTLLSVSCPRVCVCLWISVWL